MKEEEAEEEEEEEEKEKVFSFRLHSNHPFTISCTHLIGIFVKRDIKQRPAWVSNRGNPGPKS